MLVNLRGHRRKGELDNVYFLCLLLCLSHKKFLSTAPLHCKQLSLSFWWRGDLFQLFLQNKIRFCFNFVVIAEDSDFFATFL